MEFFELSEDGGYSTININPKLFPLSVAYSAAYTLLEKAYITFDGDPEEEIKVKISFREESENTKKNLEKISKEFHNNLINENANRLDSNKKEYLRALLLKKSFTEINLEALEESVGKDKEIQEANESGQEEEPVFTEEDFDDELEEDFEFEDPDGIAVPWDEKYSDEKESDSEDKKE